MSTYSLRVLRLRLVDTAESQDAWVTRARRQWDGAASVTLRVLCGGSVVGMTPPRAIQWDAAPGLVWDRPGSTDEYDPALFELLPLDEDPSVLVEVVSLARPPGHIVAMGTWNATPFVAGQGTHLRTFLHLYPKHTVPDPVYAVVEIEAIRINPPPTETSLSPLSPAAIPHTLTSSSWLKQHDIPLEFTCGPVRTSLTDLYFPPFLVDCGGSYVVSNVICVQNMLEAGPLSMVLAAKGDSLAAKFHPPNGVVVMPGQRAYFSVTWSLEKAPGTVLRDLYEVELLISGGAKPHPSALFRVHMTIPKDEAVLAPYHYWVNTTCITNRPLHPSQDLPFVRSVLPVFLFHRQAALVNNALMGTNTEDGDGDFMITDCDTGLRRYVAGGMAGPGALVGGSSLFHRAATPEYVPPIDFSEVECVGTITLGKVVGVPVLYSSSINGSSGVAPAFKLTAQMLDSRWTFDDVENSSAPRSSVAETVFVYQSVSGVLQWPTTLRFHKAAGASPDQFLRITLVEVSPIDDDEMPVAACIVTIPSLTVNEGHRIPILTAFYVLDSYSLYDQLPNISLLLKGATIAFGPTK